MNFFINISLSGRPTFSKLPESGVWSEIKLQAISQNSYHVVLTQPIAKEIFLFNKKNKGKDKENEIKRQKKMKTLYLRRKKKERQ